MSLFTVALLQLGAAGFDQAANLAKGEAACREARARGADLALFPEMWNIGYTFFDPARPESIAAWEAQAIGREDTFIQHFVALAAELDMAIGLTYLERWPGAPRNSLSIIDRRGQIALTYAKVHTCDWDVEGALTRGSDFYVCDLDTGRDVVKVGAMICFDREFPESARVLMLKEAEIILTPNACELEINRLSQYRARACENMVGLAMANYPAPQENGHSVAYDGIAYEIEGRSRDMKLVEADTSEGIWLAKFDMDVLRAYRQREVWGNAFRRPDRYHSLTASAVTPPFIRPEARR